MRPVGLLLSLALLLAACAGQPTAAPSAASSAAPQLSGELTVFAAASLTEAFRAMGRAFEAANPGVKVAFNFAGSQQLVQQMAQGAPADVFASAAVKQMDDAVAAGAVASGAARTFARNRLVVIYPANNRVGVRRLQDLAQPGLKVVLAAQAVPVGQYALDFLDKAAKDAAFGPGFKDAVVKNVVSYEENVRAVLSKVTLGEGDAGIVYTTDITADAASKAGRLDIPDALNTIAAYPIAPLKSARNPALAEAFVSYVLSRDGQQTLAQYGFGPAP